MTVSGVERRPRTAHPSPVPPTGVSTPLPRPIQGAERRSGTRARHTAFRWGLRVLVVAGLAGAAWLLTGSAAQAADRADESDGPLLESLVGADAVSPVADLLQAAAQPLENSGPAHREPDPVSDILDVPRPAPTGSVETIDDDGHDPFDAIVDTLTRVDDVEGRVAAPTRPTGEAAPDQPGAIANRMMARHMPAIAPDVEVRPHDAKAPTFSPD